MTDVDEKMSPSTASTVLVASFVLALLGLMLGFHNITQRQEVTTVINGLARTHAATNAAARLATVEADRDELQERVDALDRRLAELEAKQAQPAPE